MLEIAKILKPQGIKGEVKALPLTNVLAVFNSIKDCMIENKTFNIAHVSIRQGFLYIKFNEINTRNDAEMLRDKKIKVDKSVLENAKQEDEFLIDDLLGMVLHDENGNIVGQIVDVINYGASDIFIIEHENRKYQVPYVDEVFINENGRLMVNSEKLKEVMIW